MIKNKISPKAFIVADLLDKIDLANEMIALHQDDTFIMSEYQRHRESFVKELRTLLLDFEVTTNDLAAA